MWRSVSGSDAQVLFDSWMVAFKSDRSTDPQRVKAVRAKPKTGVDGCYDRRDVHRRTAGLQQQAGLEVQRVVSCLFECPP